MPVRTELFRIVLRHGIEVENALEPTLEFLDAYPGAVADAASPTESFGEEDLRRANRGGARISAAFAVVLLLGGCAWFTGRIRERYGNPPWGHSTGVSR